MFEFLFKRPGDKPDEATAGQPAQPQQGAAPAGGQTSLARQQQAEKVAGLRGDEAGAADFILTCEFSELRLAAAEFIRSRAQLERVHAGIRNTDRRVAKLLQARLDAIRHHESECQRGEACIAQAETLIREDKLTPNHVADLDRKWSVVAAPELKDRFEALRAGLAGRLEAQVVLQRAMIDRLNSMRKLGASGMPAAELAAQLERMAQEQAAALAAPEYQSLPRSLTNEFASEHARLQASLSTLEQGQSAIAARAAALAGWQAAEPATLNAEQMKNLWRQLPQAPDAAAADLQQRFDELLASAPAAVLPAPHKAKEIRERKDAAQLPDQHFLDKVEAMEQALQHGSLGTAADMDKALKETRGVRLTPALQDRLAHARAELKRLSDWARWGGNVSREELIKAVEQLPVQKLAMPELAKKVGSMRDRWKALDTLSGSAPKSLWEKFDAACTTAYAPAAAHFKHLADERHTNAAKAQALIGEALAETAKLDGAAVDWKHMAHTVQRLRMAWSHLGAIDRKDKKRLDHEFTSALNAMQAPLESQRKAEVTSREDMIAQVNALNPNDRHSLDALRALQERWQEHARALPLERKSEQALWQRFRAACDAVFARRKESAHAADAERRSHQEAKEALCARMEAAALDAAPANAGKLLRDAAAEWHAIGPVPRANEAKIDKRYHAAVAAIQHHVDTAKRNAGKAQATALRDKLRLCQQLEAEVARPGGESADWNARWTALPGLPADYERALKGRFDAALAALESGREAYAAKLAANRDQLLHEILRLEIAAGIDSGSEFARERLKLQVETLQSSLKSGQKPASQATQFLSLCAMPALVDDRTASRIDHLFARIAREGK
ncbi:MAG: DUF349 domain-containing protein [Telluria sp.]|nr:DUF349 domain-containing protein [Telluria sp.]